VSSAIIPDYHSINSETEMSELFTHQEFTTRVVHQYIEPGSWMDEFYQNDAMPDVYLSLYEKMSHMVDNLESDWDNA